MASPIRVFKPLTWPATVVLRQTAGTLHINLSSDHGSVRLLIVTHDRWTIALKSQPCYERNWCIIISIRNILTSKNISENKIDLSSEPDKYKDYKFTKKFAKEASVLTIPPSAFYSAEHKHLAGNYARFCFIKVNFINNIYTYYTNYACQFVHVELKKDYYFSDIKKLFLLDKY